MPDAGMKEFKVIYQDTPFDHTQPATLMVEAQSRAHAFITAYDYLVRKGHAVDSSRYWIYEKSGVHGLEFLTEELVEIRASGVPDEYGRTHIIRITEYKVKVEGKIL
jgi:hypothetical protein